MTSIDTEVVGARDVDIHRGARTRRQTPLAAYWLLCARGALLLAFPCVSISQAQQPVTVADAVGDVRIRRTDIDADGPVDPNAHRLPDIASYQVGLWRPNDPSLNLFDGQWATSAEFFRLDLVFDGLVNPPGLVGCCGYTFDPFLYGPNPVFGYVEIDMDADEDTGGDLNWPYLLYLGNAARWGGLPAEPRFADRAALDLSAFDHDVTTPPYAELSGEDFHLELLGWKIDSIDATVSGNGDYIFESGETWVLTGEFFPRAYGYEPFSYASGTGSDGKYDPQVQLQFDHDIATDETTVSLVYPLTNAGAAAIAGGEPIEPNDGDASNQSSVVEGLDDLVFSATNAPSSWRNNPDFVIIERWEQKLAADYLDPSQWRFTIATASSYTAQEGPDMLLVWTDILTNVTPGDFDGDGDIDCDDLAAFDGFLDTYDGVPQVDEDGAVNGVFDIVSFGPNFSVYDVDYNGLVNAADRPRLPGDLDDDDDVDLTDLGVLLDHYGQTGVGGDEGDLDGDGDVDLADLAVLLWRYGTACG